MATFSTQAARLWTAPLLRPWWKGARATGRVAMHPGGGRTVTTPAPTTPTPAVKTSYKDLRPFRRADGHTHSTQKEERVSSPARGPRTCTPRTR